jgi:eukaryotic-like serine/threonine-protein kinase
MVNELDEFIQKFETARARDRSADLAAFLPQADHPLYRAVLAELIRVDMEYGWEHGLAKPLADYQRRFPEIAEDSAVWPQIGFEEYRQRRQAGDLASAEEYRRRFGSIVDGWPDPQTSAASHGTDGRSEPGGSSEFQARSATVVTLEPPPDQAADAVQLSRTRQADAGDTADAGPPAQAEWLRDMSRSEPAAAERLKRVLNTMPEAGGDFLDFHLVSELGRGAFGRVFLAEQKHLAGRRVALKISTNLFDESQTLAQLQHTNIVPIYSAHEAEPFQAVCMPYLGSTTLANVLSSFHKRNSLPVSGKGLVTTLNHRRNSTLDGKGPLPADANAERGQAAPSSDRPHSTPACADSAVPEDPGEQIGLKRLERFTYVEAVLWLGARLADGLAHAHEHGIVHRDLKPANVLLANDGQPLLLDFNLSENSNLRRSSLGAAAGGTLPYMAPEHLERFNDRRRRVDARSDLYSLGLILFEMLTGRPAFPYHKGSPRDVVAPMIADRKKLPPRLRPHNKAISPAVESIIRHCLEPSPDRRYQSARELQEDLERQLDNRPLRFARDSSLRERARKWARRHPRLTSSASVAVLALALIGTLASALVLHQDRLASYQAVDTLNRFRADLHNAQFLLYSRSPSQHQLDQGIDQCRQALARYQVLGNADWQTRAEVRNLPPADQEQLQEDIGEALLLTSRATFQRAVYQPDSPRPDDVLLAVSLNQQAERCYEPGKVPRALWQQRGELLKYQKNDGEAARLLRLAEETPLRSARDCYLAAQLAAIRGNFRKALPLLVDAVQQDPQYFAAWFVKGNCHDNLLHHGEAIACYSTCIALRPRFHWAWFNRGLAHLRQTNFERAVADFDQAIALEPDLAEAYLNRGLAQEGLGRLENAIADLSRALELGTPRTQVYFLRAGMRAKAKDDEGARRDREEGMRLQPADEQSWVARGLAHLPGDPKEALADFDRALKLNPRSFPALQNKAHVLADHLHDDGEAVRVLDRIVGLYPDCAMGRAGRGVSLARLGHRDKALADGEQALLLDTRPANLYQVACIYALTSRTNTQDRLRAFDLLSYGLKGGFGLDIVDTDSDLDPVRPTPEFRRLVEAARGLQL